MALAHDLMRGLKDGQPFWLMEQTPSSTACRDVNPLKRPGLLRLWSWQAVATAPTRCCSSSSAPRGVPARSTTARSSATPAARTPGCFARSPSWAPNWTGSARPRWAPGPRPGSRCCSTGTAGGRWRSPTGRRDSSGTWRWCSGTTVRCGTQGQTSTSSR
ncbi:beta-galactosidase [Micromonospora sp. BRA006-A]|nr:beta-galactosidase [Micromonospora sp. BRA006-A]